MTVFNVIYLGDGELVGMALPLMQSLRRWPVERATLETRSLPKTWSAEQAELAAYNAEAVRALVALARELRAGGERRPGPVSQISLVCSAERAEMLTRMFVVEPSQRRGNLRITVDRGQVAVRVRDGNAEEAWRLAIRRKAGAEALRDEYEVGVGVDKLLCQVAPRVLGRAGSELYAALRSQGIAIAEAVELVEVLDTRSAW
jgi:hypothetical protein